MPEMSHGTTVSDPQRRNSICLRWRLLALVVGLGAASYVGLKWRVTSTEPPLPLVVTPRDYQRAREAFELKYGRPADRLDVASWLAEWNLARKKPADAIACFAVIPTSHPLYGRMARYQQGRTLLSLHRAVEAEQQFRELISAEENSPTLENRYLIDARQNLRHILEVELRFEERQKLLRGVVARGEEDSDEAVFECFPSLLRWNGPNTIEWLEQFHAASPASPWLEIALGRYRMSQGKIQEARQILEAAVRDDPGNLWATAALIACLREGDDPAAAVKLVEELPPQSANDPWLLLLQRGAIALQTGQGREAAAAFEQLLRDERSSTEAWQGVAQAARLLNDIPRRSKALEMVNALGRIQNYLGRTIQDASDPSSFLDVADLCAETGLIHEGAVMTRCALRVAPDNERVRATVKTFQQRLAADNQPPLLGN